MLDLPLEQRTKTGGDQTPEVFTMTNTTYNGWANWETWNFMNYYGEAINDKHEELADEMHDDGTYDSDDLENALISYVENFIEMLIDETPEQASSFAKDFLFHGYRAIDVCDIVHSVMG